MKALVVMFLLLLTPIASAAPAQELVEIRPAAGFTLRPDRAYLLFRTNSRDTRIVRGISPVFLRIPTAAEMEAYDAAKRSAFAKAEPQLKRRREELLARKAQAERTGQTFAKS
jgi:hypothetical protein